MTPTPSNRNAKDFPGLGVLPHRTTITSDKTTRQVNARLVSGDIEFEAYEIHMGETQPASDETPFCRVEGRPEGSYRRGILGTYLHGALEDERVVTRLLADVAAWRRKKTPVVNSGDKQAEYDKLADWFERWTDLDLFQELYLP